MCVWGGEGILDLGAGEGSDCQVICGTFPKAQNLFRHLIKANWRFLSLGSGGKIALRKPLAKLKMKIMKYCEEDAQETAKDLWRRFLVEDLETNPHPELLLLNIKKIRINYCFFCKLFENSKSIIRDIILLLMTHLYNYFIKYANHLAEEKYSQTEL